jgi:2-dehydropantoate 2-reductase
MMKITVLGCGALGQLWLSALYQKGHDVQGWMRVAQPFCAVNVISPTGTAFNHNLPTNDPQHLAESELLLITLKAWQVSGAISALLHLINDKCTLLLLHNGLGTLEELPANNLAVLQGATTHAAKREGNTIIHVASGITHIGPVTPQAAHCSGLADMLHDALPVLAWHNDISPFLWQKLAVNCVINPLTALHQCRNGELLPYAEQITEICHEVADVMAIEGYHTHTDTLISHVYQVMESTSANYSSMLQDIMAQRHTEIDYITGYLLRRARRHGLQLPANSQLFNQIKQKESHYERSGMSGTW